MALCACPPLPSDITGCLKGSAKRFPAACPQRSSPLGFVLLSQCQSRQPRCGEPRDSPHRPQGSWTALSQARSCCCVSISTWCSSCPRPPRAPGCGGREPDPAGAIALRGWCVYPHNILHWPGLVFVLITPCSVSPTIPVGISHLSQGTCCSWWHLQCATCPKGQGGQQGPGPCRGFRWCNGHGKGAVSGHRPGSSGVISRAWRGDLTSITRSERSGNGASSC